MLVLVASSIGWYALFCLLGGTLGGIYQLDWPMPFGPALFAVDPLSALFLFPLFLVSGCVALYSLSYWPAAERSDSARLTLFVGVFTAAMVLVLLVRNGVLFLMAWELMALAAYFLLTTEQHNREAQKAGTIYLLATHSGTMALFALFSLLHRVTGSFLLPAPHSLSTSVTLEAVILVTALIGFGGKAGLMPLHFWLPGAHANAPSHVSAMMSGLMLKMGVYGILRTVLLFVDLPGWFGWLLLVLGGWSALNGIALAAGQRDLKRLLACSSIENIGIIFIGIGMALVGLQTGAQVLFICGFFGAFLHIVNHGLFKSVLFLGSGVVLHSSGTREMDRMGGLAKRMPVTAALFLVASLAICGLPPLNGFVGELFLYLGALYDGIASPLPVLALVAPLLALVGGMAAITFVKAYGTIFLGTARSTVAEHRHAADGPMVGPMLLLAVCCLAIGLAPLLLVRMVAPVVRFYSGADVNLADLGGLQIPLMPLTALNLLLLALIVVLAVCYRLRLHGLPKAASATWGCAYQAPSPRIQYTGTSFSEMMVNLVGYVAAPQRLKPVLAGFFPARTATFSYRPVELLLDRVLTPLFSWIGLAFSYMRRLQHGQLHIYVLYVFATLFVLMIWAH